MFDPSRDAGERWTAPRAPGSPRPLDRLRLAVAQIARGDSLGPETRRISEDGPRRGRSSRSVPRLWSLRRLTGSTGRPSPKSHPVDCPIGRRRGTHGRRRRPEVGSVAAPDAARRRGVVSRSGRVRGDPPTSSRSGSRRRHRPAPGFVADRRPVVAARPRNRPSGWSRNAVGDLPGLPSRRNASQRRTESARARPAPRPPGRRVDRPTRTPPGSALRPRALIVASPSHGA